MINLRLGGIVIAVSPTAIVTVALPMAMLSASGRKSSEGFQTATLSDAPQDEPSNRSSLMSNSRER